MSLLVWLSVQGLVWSTVSEPLRLFQNPFLLDAKEEVGSVHPCVHKASILVCLGVCDLMMLEVSILGRLFPTVAVFIQLLYVAKCPLPCVAVGVYLVICCKPFIIC